jgi:hypothetical protein
VPELNSQKKRSKKAEAPALNVLNDDGDEFNFDRLFEDAASFTKTNLKDGEIHYPRGSTISKRSPLIKELFANAR